MDFSVVSLLYKDPPVTKAELKSIQQSLEPVNYPSNQELATISNEAKVLAEKIVEKKVKEATPINQESPGKK